MYSLSVNTTYYDSIDYNSHGFLRAQKVQDDHIFTKYGGQSIMSPILIHAIICHYYKISKIPIPVNPIKAHYMQQKSVYIYLNFYAYPLAIQLFASVLSENIENLVMQYIRKYILSDEKTTCHYVICNFMIISYNKYKTLQLHKC